MEDRNNRDDWGDFTLNITVMPPERTQLCAGLADEELVPTRPFKKPTLDQLSPSRKPAATAPATATTSRPISVPLPLRAGTLHSVAGLPLPPGPLAPRAATPPPKTTLESLRATTGAPRPTPGTHRPSSRLTPAFGTRLTPTSGIRRIPAPRGDGSRPGASRRNRSRWARELLQRFNFDDCA